MQKSQPSGTPSPDPLLARAWFNSACIHSMASIGKAAPMADSQSVSPAKAEEHRSKAVEHLRKAFQYGWNDMAHIRKDTDLDPIRDLPAFKALLAEFEKKGK
jgi:hypothetical protein